MLQNRQRTTWITGLLAGCCVLGIGCENSDARRHAEAQEVLTQASRSLQSARVRAMSSENAGTEAMKSSLQQVLQRIDSVAGAPGGLAATQAGLAATTLRELAIIEFAEAETLEAQHRLQRDVLAGKVGAVLRIAGQAAGLDGVSVEQIRRMLAEERQVAERRLSTASASMAELDGPITEAQQENSSDAAEATRLLERANVTWRNASQKGSARGLAEYVEGWRLTREADRLEYRIANREALLSYELRPEHEFAGAQAEHARSLLQRIDATQSQLSDFESLNMDQAAALRRSVNTQRQNINNELKVLRQSAETKLLPVYAAAETRLERASTEASRAGTGSKGNVEAARVHELRGRLFWSRASGLQNHLSLLTLLREAADDVGGFDGLDADLTATARAYAEAVARAREAYNEAKSAIGGASGLETAILRNALDSAIAGLGGDFTDIPMHEVDDDSSHDGSMIAASSAPASGGFPTPEDVIDAMIRTSTSNDPMEQFGLYRARDPRGQQALQTMQTLAESQVELNRAMAETFGSGASIAADQMGMGSTPLNRGMFSERSRNDDVVEYSIMGQMPLLIIKVDDSWYADAAFFSTTADMMKAQGMDFNAMMRSMQSVMRDLADRVRDGEFSSAAEVNDAFLQAIMAAMSQPG